MARRAKQESATVLDVPAPRPPAIRSRRGGVLPLAELFTPPVHWVLAGGGAHGAVQLGTAQAMTETDADRPDAILGTSAGALTGAVVAEDPVAAVNRLTYVWSELDLGSIVGDSWLGLLNPAGLTRVSLADSAGERESLEAILTARSFSDLDIPLAAIATDLDSGQPVALESGELIPALLASSAIPGVLPPVEIGGRWYMDGLASANLPASLAMRRGAGTIVVFDTGTSVQREAGTSLQQVVPAVNSLLAAQQRVSSLTTAARAVPVLYLPTPSGLAGALSFKDSLGTAKQSYELARGFLIDLVDQFGSAPLGPGLYARADGWGSRTRVEDVLRPVVSTGQEPADEMITQSDDRVAE